MSSQKKFTFAISFPDEFLVLLNFSKLPTQILQKIAKNAFQAVILRYFSEIGSFRGALRKSGRRYEFTQTFCDRNVAQSF